MGNRIWYYSKDGEKSGPFTIEAILEFAETHLIVSETLVWREGFDEWAPANTCEEISYHFNQAHSPPPLPQESENHRAQESPTSPPPRLKTNRTGLRTSTKMLIACFATGLLFAFGSSDSGTGASFLGYAIGAGIALLAAIYLTAWFPGGLYWLIKRQEMPYIDRVLWIVWVVFSLLIIMGLLAGA